MKTKIFLIVLILIILTIISFFIWRFWSRPSFVDGTPYLRDHSGISKWQTYSNKDIGFEFKYPPDWKIKSDPAFNEVITLEIADLTQKKVFFPFGVEDEYIYPIYTIHFQIDRKKYFEDMMTDNHYDIQKIELNNINTYQFKSAAAPSSGSAIVSLLEKDGRYISVTYIAYAHVETHFKFEHVYNQILSTFKFID